jgi:hypothetical protein
MGLPLKKVHVRVLNAEDQPAWTNERDMIVYCAQQVLIYSMRG